MPVAAAISEVWRSLPRGRCWPGGQRFRVADHPGRGGRPRIGRRAAFPAGRYIAPGNQARWDGYSSHLPHGFDFSAARVERSLEVSLTRLQTYVVDLFLAHEIGFAFREQILGQTRPALRRLKEKGNRDSRE